MWLEKLPKIELHCHLDGSIPISVLKKLCLLGDIAIPQNDIEFRKLIEAKEDCESLTEYLQAFALPLKCLKTEDAFFIASYETVAKAAQEGTRYLELRFAPLLSETKDLPAEKIIEAAIAGLQKATKEYHMDAGFILCGMRHFHEKQNMRTLDLAKKYLQRGVCGLDLAGDESAFPNEQFATYFQKAIQYDVPFTIHAGECGRSENIKLAVQYGAKRIGHGIAMRQNTSLQNAVIRHGVGVEMCPSSNMQTKAVSSWENYPFREFLEQGVLISINTDNRTVTNTTMTKELQLLQKQFHLTCQEAGTLMKQALTTSFVEESTKKEIQKEILAWEKAYIS